MSRTTFLVYAWSLGAHAILAVAITSIPAPARQETVRFTMREVPSTPPEREEPPVEVPSPAPAPPPETKPKPKGAPAQKKARDAGRAPPSTKAPVRAPSAVPELGVALTGGVSGGGVAVPVGDPGGEARPRRSEARDLGASSEGTGSGGCAEPETRPKVLELPQPSYDDAARADGVQGRVRVRIGLDAEGRVTEVEVLESLHPGLDQAAVRAAKAARFEPARRCGVAVAATFNLSIRFDL